jgi:selenophosphate synthase
VLFDAQTSGGLLIAVAPGSREALLDALDGRGVEGAAIGRLTEGDGKIRVS